MSSLIQIDDIAQPEDVPLELELTADELLTLRAPRTIDRPRPIERPTPIAERLADPSPAPYAGARLQPRASSLSLTLSGAVAAALMGPIIYLTWSPELQVAASSVTQAAPLAPIVRSLTLVPASQPMLVPVRYTNPFDRSEVFEFPPGTTRRQAHDAVAALLIERARGRHPPQHLRTAALRRAEVLSNTTPQWR
jgi:hypothetical protein